MDKQTGKYSKKRKTGVIRNKKNKYTDDPEEKHFKNVVYDMDYYEIITHLMELLPIQYIEKIPLENDNIFKEYIRQQYNDKNYKPVRFVDFIEAFKLFVDNGTHDETDVLYTYRTFFNIIDEYIIYDNNFYLKDEVKEACSSIMVGIDPNLHKYFFEKILPEYNPQDNLMDYILEYDRLNKKNSTGDFPFIFTSLKELCDDISTRFHNTVIDTSKYDLHRWS